MLMRSTTPSRISSSASSPRAVFDTRAFVHSPFLSSRISIGIPMGWLCCHNTLMRPAGNPSRIDFANAPGWIISFPWSRSHVAAYPSNVLASMSMDCSLNCTDLRSMIMDPRIMIDTGKTPPGPPDHLGRRDITAASPPHQRAYQLAPSAGPPRNDLPAYDHPRYGTTL